MRPLKIITIIGARPQIIKAAAISRAIKNHFSDAINEVLVHTGQHYDNNMSGVFFEELGIPQPDYNLQIGSGDHATQTARMLEASGTLLADLKPDVLLLYGDTNSTLAAALAAAKLHIPIIHIEGGLRSFKKSYPEEINRIVSDHLSTLIFSPSFDGYNNLLKEGFKKDNQPPYTIDNPKIYHCGDIMYDNSMYFSSIAETKPSILKKNDLLPDEYILVTIHRENNTNDPARLNAYFRSILRIAKSERRQFIIPLHPRTTKILDGLLEPEVLTDLKGCELVKIVPPVSFLEMIELEKNARMVMTDSGGVQKEAFFFKKPVIIFLRETPWIELVESGTALLVDADEHRIEKAYSHFNNNPDLKFPQLYGDGHAAEYICGEIINNFVPAILKSVAN